MRTTVKEDGVAMVAAVLAVMLMSAIVAGLSLASAADTLIASSFRTAEEGLFAGDAALERAVSGARRTADWRLITSGATRSDFVDGSPAGARTVVDGRRIDPSLLASAAGPRWVPFAYGPLAALLPDGSISSSFYVVVLASASRPDRDDVLELRAQAFGPRGSRQQVEATLARTAAPPGSRLLSWRLVR